MQNIEAGDIRCRKCRTLLAVLEDGEIVIERGGLQARLDGGHRVTIVCYRCRQLNVYPLRQPDGS